MRRAVAAAVALVACCVTVSCTTRAPSPTAARTKPGAITSASSLGAHRECPVTRPLAHASPLAIPPLPVPYIHGWYGNNALWIGVPTGGVLPAERPYGTPWPNEWGTKFPWWRGIDGTLTITAHRLDGPSGGFHAEVPSGYGITGFIPSGLIWPALGCWQVTGTVAGRSLTFVTEVKASDS